MRNGFVQLPLAAWIGIGSAIVMLGMGIAIKVQTARLDTAKAEIVKVQAEYDSFVDRTAEIGLEQERKNKELMDKRKRVNDETIKSANARLADILARYNRLLNTAPGAGSGAMPGVPDTTKPIDDATRDQRLLEVLRAAEIQAGQLIELQEWIRQHLQR